VPIFSHSSDCCYYGANIIICNNRLKKKGTNRTVEKWLTFVGKYNLLGNTLESGNMRGIMFDPQMFYLILNSLRSIIGGTTDVPAHISLRQETPRDISNQHYVICMMQDRRQVQEYKL
jgi:hypothetical protein